ncbi:MAG: ATP-binding cassette domain-containing protein [Ferruginibacter sp.]
MKEFQHTAFYITHEGEKDWLISQINAGKLFSIPLLNELNGEIFSNSTLQHFIDEEFRHDHFEIATINKNSLSSSSSGEQRNALLAYIIEKKPGYIIIDNVFESLDKETRQSILIKLSALSATILFLQVFNRKSDLLPFIHTVYSIEGRRLISCKPRELFLEQPYSMANNTFEGSIPTPLARYELPDGPLVKMNGVSVKYNGRPVLQNIYWEINAGEFWHLTGPNGSGKTTLLSLITGNSSKGYGQDLLIFGQRKGTGETVWQLKEKIGYFTPTMTLHFDRQDSIEQMIISGFYDSVGLYITPTDRQVSLAREWLSVIKMDKYRMQPFRTIPPANQRMVLIARAMVKHPPLLILDEPTSGLDDEEAALFTHLINKIASETNTAILYVSHRDEEGLCPDKIYTLSPESGGSTGKIYAPSL